MTLLLLAALSCPKTVKQNVSGYPWNKYDNQMLVQARKRCGELYDDSPCVKLWRKFGKKSYTVICGAKK